MSMACAIMFLKLHIILYQLLGRWISQNGNLWEMDITKCESLGFHVRTDFTTCLKIDPQGDMHPTLVKTQNIL
jgi:hypothetical protein